MPFRNQAVPVRNLETPFLKLEIEKLNLGTPFPSCRTAFRTNHLRPAAHLRPFSHKGTKNKEQRTKNLPPVWCSRPDSFPALRLLLQQPRTKNQELSPSLCLTANHHSTTPSLPRPSPLCHRASPGPNVSNNHLKPPLTSFTVRSSLRSFSCMARKASSKPADSTANLGFEAKLWLGADKLRKNMDAAVMESSTGPAM